MKKTLLALSLPYLLSAHTLPELFNALESHSQTKYDEINVEKAGVVASQVTSKLYPKINLFGSYDNYSTPSGMVPVPPNKLVKLVKVGESNPNNPPSQPFSYNIYRAGAKFSMPIFVKSLYTTADKAKAMQKSAKAKKHINILQNEALIVGVNANYIYLDAMLQALHVKEESLQETKKTIQIKVNNGRSPASALYKITDALNQVAIAKNNIKLEEKKLISSIQTLTGIVLNKPVAMHLVTTSSENIINKSSMGSLKPLREKLRADRLGIKAEKEKLYPSLFAHGSYVFSQAKAYNNHNDINEEYGNIGLVLNIPLLAMDSYAGIKLSKIQLRSGEIKLEKLTDELSAEAKSLEDSLPLLNNSLTLYTRSIADKQKLLKIAKVNYFLGRMTTEDYLLYENELVDAKANLYKVKAQRFQILMKLAVIYANNIEEIVK